MHAYSRRNVTTYMNYLSVGLRVSMDFFVCLLSSLLNTGLLFCLVLLKSGGGVAARRGLGGWCGSGEGQSYG